METVPATATTRASPPATATGKPRYPSAIVGTGVFALLLAAVGPLAGCRWMPQTESPQTAPADITAPRPIAAADSLWLEELTWMEIRDAVAAGRRSVLIPTGGIEQNGPYVVTGKHNLVVAAQCEAIARSLGDTLCAPVVGFVPEGDIARRSGHMAWPGTISVREQTFEMLLEDVAESLVAAGFTEVLFIGDSGGNQQGMARVARRLSERWPDAVARYIPEYYDNEALASWMHEELGITEPVDEGLHDTYWSSAQVIAVDPRAARVAEREVAGLASINGVAVAPASETAGIGRRLARWRTERTVAAIKAARANATTASGS
jgi:creatinine amidohydrolase